MPEVTMEPLHVHAETVKLLELLGRVLPALVGHGRWWNGLLLSGHGDRLLRARLLRETRWVKGGVAGRRSGDQTKEGERPSRDRRAGLEAEYGGEERMRVEWMERPWDRRKVSRDFKPKWSTHRPDRVPGASEGS